MLEAKSSETKYELSIDQKRLDTLAKILECSSMCVAVTQLDGKFLIAANEFNKNTKEPDGNQQLNLITEIMNFFKNIADKPTTSSDEITRNRDLLMQKICSARLSVLGQGKLNVPPEAIQKFITTQRLETESHPSTTECTEFQKQTKKSNIHAAFFDMLIIYRKFLKIEHSIKHASDDDSKVMSLKHLKAFQTFSQDCVLREGTAKAHAEMQILGKLIDKEIKGRVHIGISKLCCIQCRCVLDVAKEALEQQGYLNLSYKGTHERSFGKNWCFPNSFYGGGNDTLKASIREEYLKRIKEKLESTGMYNQYEDTDSEQSLSQDSSRQKINYQNHLEENHRIFIKMPVEDKNKTISELLELINLGQSLFFLGSAPFKDLFDLDDSNETLVLDSVIFSLSGVHKYDLLTTFLDSSYFPVIKNKEKIISGLKERLERLNEQLLEPKDKAHKSLGHVHDDPSSSRKRSLTPSP